MPPKTRRSTFTLQTDPLFCEEITQSPGGLTSPTDPPTDHDAPPTDHGAPIRAFLPLPILHCCQPHDRRYDSHIPGTLNGQTRTPYNPYSTSTAGPQYGSGQPHHPHIPGTLNGQTRTPYNPYSTSTVGPQYGSGQPHHSYIPGTLNGQTRTPFKFYSSPTVDQQYYRGRTRSLESLHRLFYAPVLPRSGFTFHKLLGGSDRERARLDFSCVSCFVTDSAGKYHLAGERLQAQAVTPSVTRIEVKAMYDRGVLIHAFMIGVEGRETLTVDAVLKKIYDEMRTEIGEEEKALWEISERERANRARDSRLKNGPRREPHATRLIDRFGEFCLFDGLDLEEGGVGTRKIVLQLKNKATPPETPERRPGPYRAPSHSHISPGYRS